MRVEAKPAPDWPEGTGRIVLASTGSTMEEGRVRAGTRPPPFWVLAHAQTGARGRRGRPWLMPEGNFAATWVGEAPLATAPLLSFAAALALRDALVAVRGAEGLSLKWPNDVLLGGRKLAGILLEGLPGGLVAVGVGVNLAAAPSAGDLPEGALPPAALDAPCWPETFLGLLAPAFARWEGVLRRQGFAPVRAAWLEGAAGLGGPIAVRLPGGTVRGTFRDLGADGTLVVGLPEGERRVAAGEVFLGGEGS